MTIVARSSNSYGCRGSGRSCKYSEKWRVRTGKDKEGDFWESTVGET